MGLFSQRQTERDARGELVDGRTFNGAIELVRLLQSRKKEIYRHFAEKLLTYALGRGLEPYDNCAVDDILTTAKQSGYRMSSFIRGVVHSEPFVRRTAQSTEIEQIE